MSQEIEDNYKERDVMLDFFVGMVNKTDIEITITLYVQGLLVSGLLVSYYNYLEGISKSFGTVDNEVGQIFSENLAKMKEVVKENRDNEDIESPKVNFVHLKDVTIYNLNEKTTLKSDYWRGKLRSVDGFNIGNYTIE